MHEGAYEDVFYIVAEGSVVVSKKMLDEERDRILRVEAGETWWVRWR